LFLPIVGAVLVGIAGFWGVREVVNQSPMRVLRRL
jgi:putative ABC transport system permease protein